MLISYLAILMFFPRINPGYSPSYLQLTTVSVRVGSRFTGSPNGGPPPLMTVTDDYLFLA